MKNRKIHFLLLLLTISTALAIFSIIFISCPPLEEDPYDTTVKITSALTLSEWEDILDDIYTKGLPTILDLSECTIPPSGGDILKHSFEDGTDYDPDSIKAENIYNNYIQINMSMGSRNGKELITSIILPDAATMINNASGNIDLDFIDNAEDNEKNRYAFRHFTNLKSVTGRNIKLIGTFAFYNCSSLEEVNMPNVNIVMQYAFYNCDSLRRLEFEKLRHIQPSAFENCSSLERAEFHTADIIPQRAFMNCTDLREVSFSNVMLIEADAFRNCSKLRIARFLADPIRTNDIHPLNPWKSGNFEVPYSNGTLAFHNNVFRGCTSLETLDIRKAWNVYFGAGALSDIGTSLTLWLFDDNGTKCWGHPQVELLLGKRPVPEAELTLKEKEMDIGRLTLKTLSILTPNAADSFLDSQIFKVDTGSAANDGDASIRNRINAVYNPGDRHIEFNEPKNPVVKVTVNGRPSASHQYND